MSTYTEWLKLAKSEKYSDRKVVVELLSKLGYTADEMTGMDHERRARICADGVRKGGKSYSEWLNLALSDDMLKRKKIYDELHLLGYEAVDIIPMPHDLKAQICFEQRAKEQG